MDAKDIIANLEDLAEAKEEYAHMIGTDDTNDPDRKDATVLREAARLLRELAAPNGPLTLDELREMDGDPMCGWKD